MPMSTLYNFVWSVIQWYNF